MPCCLAGNGSADRINVTPRVVVWPELHPGGFAVAYYGWPWCYTFIPLSFAAKVPYFGNVHVLPWGYRALAEDAAVGVVLVVVLTWASSHLIEPSHLSGSKLSPYVRDDTLVMR